MDYRALGRTGLEASVIGLGTWVMGGGFWSGADDKESLAAIRRAIELGVNLIDTAPVYGHGRAEALVGEAIREAGCRDRIILATKVGLNWNAERTRIWRDSSPARIRQEVHDSLRRLRTDRIDLYQVHWPDNAVPFETTMDTLQALQKEGLIGAIGVSNFDVAQLARCLAVAPVEVVQPPYNLLERGIEATLLPFCRQRNIGTVVYSALCRGLLTGKYRGDETFDAGDIRGMDPKFKPPRFAQYVACVGRLAEIATRYGKTVAQLAVRWCLDQPGITVALCGARRPAQIEDTVQASGWSIAESELAAIDRILAESIPEPIGPEFMGPKKT